MTQASLELDFTNTAALPPQANVPVAALWGRYTPSCPITRQLLGGSGADAPVVEALGLVAGTAQVVVSRRASVARAGCAFTAAMAQWRHLETGHSQEIAGLGLAAWRRWTVLLSFASPLSDVEAARLPLVLLPPPGVQPQHPLQRLQVLITEQLAAPGWSGRLRRLADELQAPRLREDFQLFVGALAPRLLELADDLSPRAQRQALEDLWLDATVRRRWTHLAVQLGSAGAEQLLRAAQRQATTAARDLAPRGPRADRSGRAAARLSTRPATAGRPPKNSSLTIGASAW